jgi:ABC-type multidrug transport system permease subunit
VVEMTGKIYVKINGKKLEGWKKWVFLSFAFPMVAIILAVVLMSVIFLVATVFLAIVSLWLVFLCLMTGKKKGRGWWR